MKLWIYVLASVGIVSLISLLGIITLAWDQKRLKALSTFLVALAVGALMGNAFLHLIPHSFEQLGFHLSTSLLMIGGVLLFFGLEKFIRWRHCHVSDMERHPHPMVAMNLIGDGVHNFIDGMLIAATYQTSIPLGITTTLAITLHEIPQEIADFGVLIYGGLSIPKAIFANFAIATTSLLGALVVLLIPGSHSFSIYLMPVTAGCFLYIAGSDLVPELQHEVQISTSIFQLLSILAGLGIMIGFSFLGGH